MSVRYLKCVGFFFSLPVSLLLVGALKRYSEMVCEKVKPLDETDAGNKGWLAWKA